MSENVTTMSIHPPVAWTTDVVKEDPGKGRVRLRFFHGSYPPPPDATAIVSVEFPALDAEKIGKALVEASHWEQT